MLSLEINSAHKIDAKTKAKAAKIQKSLKTPPFVSHQPDIAGMRKALKPLVKYKRVLVVGNGGSIQSFRAFAGMLIPDQSRWALVHTPEPDYLNQLRKQFSPKDTLVIPISKSGSNVAQLEAMLAFKDYPMLAVTGRDGTLWEIAKAKKIPTIEHPSDVGGRYAGRTSAALVPALALGIDIEAIDAGAQRMYALCGPQVPLDKNPALKAAALIAQLNQKKYDQLFAPFYSTRLAAFLPLLVQLIHESSGKKGKGITCYGDVAPESQHHTNQRFFGGPRDAIGLFFRLAHQSDEVSMVKVDSNLKGIKLRDATLGVLDGISLRDSLEFEYQGTIQDAVQSKIPVMTVTLDMSNAQSCGELLGFMQYLTVYLCEFLGVDPYDQPQVEASKNISFSLRKNHSRS